ncbi:MAG: type IV pilus assembly protein PilM [Bdellovibrionales bacterium]|nr:type IV pilus assembly protein PilM [Bdellovibrionales bacterium]
MGLFQSKSIVGIDVGSTYIKLAELALSKKGAKLVRFSFIPTPPGALDRGEVIDGVALANAIKDLHKQSGTKSKNVCVGIWGTAVIVKKITISGVEEKFVNEIIRDEAEQYIPFDLNDINLEYWVLRNRPKSIESIDLLIIGAQKDYVFKYAEAVETAGLHCAIVDVSGFALANCFQMNYGELPGEVVGILNFGASVTNFVIVDNGDVVFSRDVPVGGQTFTSDIQKQMGISLEEAEALKMSYGRGEAAPEQVGQIIQSSCDGVIEEITRSLDFYNTTAAESPIQKFFITGGGSLTPHLKENLEKAIGLSSTYLDPFTSIQYDPKAFSEQEIQGFGPFAGVAIGLASRKVGDK